MIETCVDNFFNTETVCGLEIAMKTEFDAAKQAELFWDTDLEEFEREMGVKNVLSLPITYDPRVPPQGIVLFNKVNRCKYLSQIFYSLISYQ